MKILVILCMVCCFGVSQAFAGGATANNTTLVITLTNAAGTPLTTTDLSNLTGFSATLTWKGKTLSIPGDGIFKSLADNSWVIQISLQGFNSTGVVPLQVDDPVGSGMALSVTTNSGHTATSTIYRVKASGVQQEKVNVEKPAANPVISLSAGTICAGGGSINVTVTNPPSNWADYTLSVTPNGGNFTVSALTASTITISAKAAATAGSYTVQLIKNGVATPVSTAALTVGTVPTITITPSHVDGSDGYYCKGGADNLNVDLQAGGATAGYTYTWRKPDNTTFTSPKLSGVTTPGTYTVEVAKSGGCPAQKSVTVVEKTAPAKPVIEVPSPADVCTEDGLKTTLKVNPFDPTMAAYVWSGTDAPTSGDVSHSRVSTTGATQYTVQANDGKCTSLASASVSLRGHKLTLALSPSGSVSKPAGSKPTIVAAATPIPGGTALDLSTWSWTDTGDKINGVPVNSGVQSTITTNAVTQTSTYKATVKDVYGCSATSAMTTINMDGSTVWSVVLADKKGCLGSTISLAPTINGVAKPNVGWTWTSTSSKVSFSSPGTQNTNVSATDPGVYAVKVTARDGNGVENSIEVNVTVWGKPTLDGVKADKMDDCKGNKVQLEAVNAAASTTVMDGSATLTYVWAGATALTDKSKAEVTLVAQTNTVKLKIRDDNGCESAEKQVLPVGHEVVVTSVTLTSGGAPTTTPAYGATGSLSCAVTLNPSASATNRIDSYEWTALSGPGINGATNQATATTEKLDAAGSYQVKVKDNYGCEGTNKVDYTVSGGPLEVTLRDTYICAGAATTLSCVVSGGSGSAAPTYTWTSTDGLVFDKSTDATPKIAASVAPGTYHVKVEVRKGVQTVTSNEVIVTVGYQPSLASIAIFQNGTAVGSGGASVLPQSVVEAIVQPTSVLPGTKYNWTPKDVIDKISTPDSLTATSVKLKGSACFRLTVTNAAGMCPDWKEACVSVSGTAFVVEMPDMAICSGVSSVISSQGKVTGGVGGPNYKKYVWSCADSKFRFSVSADQKSITVDPLTSVGVYTVRLDVTDTKDNVAFDEFQVTVNATPSFVALSPTPQTVKVGNKVTLSASATPITSELKWVPGGPVEGVQQGTTGTASIVAGVFTLAGGPFQYRVEATNGTCKKDTVVEIKVIEKTAEIVVTAPNVDLCEGTSEKLKASATGGSSTASLSYRWEVPAGDDMVLASTTGNEVTIASASVGVHHAIVYVTDNGADPAPAVQKTVTVTVYANPVIDPIVVSNVATGVVGTTVEYGDELKLETKVDPSSAVLTWTETPNNSSLVSTTGKTVYTNPMTMTTNYTVKATVNGKCEATKDVTVTVNRPAVGAVLELELTKKCADSGESMILGMKATGGMTYSFTLKNNAGLSKAYTGTGPWQHLIALGDQDTYFVQDFKAFKNGVEILPASVRPAQIEALFYTTPTITIANGSVQSVCQGDALTLDASCQLSGSTIVWNNGVNNGESFYPKKSGIYTVTVTSDKGCVAKSDVNVTLIPKPTVTVGASPSTICLGDTVRLTAGGSATEFVWNTGATGASIEVVPNVGGTIKYVVTGTELLNGCSDTAMVNVVVNEPPRIVSASKSVRSIAIGKGVSFGVKATGKGLSYEWQRWTGSSWLTLYDSSTDEPTIKGSRADSLILGNVPRSWDGTKLQCVVKNSCGVADTSFLLNVKECFDILDVEWDMCQGIRPETNPGVAIDGWYCPGSRIGICARLIFDDPSVVAENVVYKWTVDGLSTTDGRWGEMKFLSDSSILSWVPPVEWQDNITIALCAYADGACDTVCKKYLRLKAMPYTDIAWKLRTSVDPSRMFCPGDTVKFWIEDENKTAGLNPKYHWYNDIFDLEKESAPYNKVISLKNEEVVLGMGQQNTWVKVVLTPSPEICTRQPQYIDTAFLKVKTSVVPSLRIECADTVACRGDEIFMTAVYDQAGLKPTFQWQRSIGDPFPDYNLGTEASASVKLDEDDVWVKCTMKPSEDVCYDQTKPIVSAIKIRVWDKEGTVTIATDMKGKKPGDELVFTSEVKNVLGTHRYEWMVNEMMSPYHDSDYVSSTLRQGDVVYCLVSGERVCQTRIESNKIEVDYGGISRDTVVTIYRNDRIRNLNLFQAGDDGKLFVMAEFPRSGIAILNLLTGEFSYVPNRNFEGVDYVRYLVKDKLDPTKTEEGHIYINVLGHGLDNLPNVITPNGDGLNDEWHLETVTEKYKDYDIKIFNRIGNLVFHCRSNYANDWNGQSMSNSSYSMPLGTLPSGVYTYVIELENGQRKLMSWLEIRADLNRSRYR